MPRCFRRPLRATTRLVCALPLLTSLASFILPASPAPAQDWGSESEPEWSSDSKRSGRSSESNEATAEGAPGDGYDKSAFARGWSGRGGIGFTADPDTFLINLDVPYAFDRWVAAGPMFQIGFDSNDTFVASTLNVTLSIPELPGNRFDRFLPYSFVGIGFAVIGDDDRRGDNSSAGFLIDFGVGLEYMLSERVALGSHMIFNFLPERTLDEKFVYSWQLVGLRFAF